MKERLTIVKVGGAIVEDEAQLAQLLSDFTAIEGPKVLVHGGGRRATKTAQLLGIETKMVDGRRITDAPMLEVVTMVYGGLINKQVVARLQALGVDAIGLCGADANIIRSHKRPLKNGVDFGFVGDVDKVSGQMLCTLLKAGLTPVIAPLTHDGEGHILNTNADTMASETARALAADFDVTLIYSFEKPGVLARPDDDSSVIARITREDFERYKADGTISGGMLPKIENALGAVEAGVGRVIITLATAIDGRLLRRCTLRAPVPHRLSETRGATARTAVDGGHFRGASPQGALPRLAPAAALYPGGEGGTASRHGRRRGGGAAVQRGDGTSLGSCVHAAGAKGTVGRDVVAHGL